MNKKNYEPELEDETLEEEDYDADPLGCQYCDGGDTSCPGFCSDCLY